MKQTRSLLIAAGAPIAILLGLAAISLYDALLVRDGGLSAVGLPTGPEGFPQLSSPDAFVAHSYRFATICLVLVTGFVVSLWRRSIKGVLASYALLAAFGAWSALASIA